MITEEEEKDIKKSIEEINKTLIRMEAIVTTVGKHDLDLNGNGKPGLKADFIQLKSYSSGAISATRIWGGVFASVMAIAIALILFSAKSFIKEIVVEELKEKGIIVVNV